MNKQQPCFKWHQYGSSMGGSWRVFQRQTGCACFKRWKTTMITCMADQPGQLLHSGLPIEACTGHPGSPNCQWLRSKTSETGRWKLGQSQRSCCSWGSAERVGILCPCNVHRVCSRHEGPCSSKNKQQSSYKQWQPSPLTGRAPAARSGYKCTGLSSCHVSCLSAARMQIASRRAHQVPGSAEHTLLASN